MCLSLNTFKFPFVAGLIIRLIICLSLNTLLIPGIKICLSLNTFKLPLKMYFKFNRKDTGVFGEEIAKRYLIKKGWNILARNYRRKSDEIDIIAKSSDGTLVFVEVKTLILKGGQGAIGFTPEDNLSSNKFRKISRTCEFFVRQNWNLISEEKGWRIDLIAICLDQTKQVATIRHYKNI